MKRNRGRPNRSRAGVTLIELVIAISLIAIPLMAVGVLLAGGVRSYQATYESVHGDVREEVLAVAAAFGSLGRRSNRSNYAIYESVGSRYIEAVPHQGEETASGQAVEFRYWEESFESLRARSESLEADNTGSHYALFYLQDTELRVDYGAVVEGRGAIRDGVRNTSDIVTRVLTEHVDVTEGGDLFSHNVVGGQGCGSVRLNLVLTDEEGQTAEIKTSTLLRIIWPQ